MIPVKSLDFGERSMKGEKGNTEGRKGGGDTDSRNGGILFSSYFEMVLAARALSWRDAGLRTQG